ncbi:MAG: carbonic anhydrase/acetyltransferase-like protein (isoleucine patch superfamily) [Salibacteraceae bacterium]|jgi:carbonic anhydrase/acetyltransferase-like protein (isoleucine patch superfamily)
MKNKLVTHYNNSYYNNYAIVEDNFLIGMGSIVMDVCYIESGSIIAAGAVLLEGEGVQRLKNKR